MASECVLKQKEPTMRLLMAMMMHETNTFSPVPTDLQRFALGLGQLPPEGPAAIEAYRHTGTATGAFIDLAESAGADFELAIAAHAAPSGPVHDEAFDAMAQTIVDAVARGGWDGILLDLHGAMVTASCEDGEGELQMSVTAAGDASVSRRASAFLGRCTTRRRREAID
jgi:microcystin degradation protein MlrC